MQHSVPDSGHDHIRVNGISLSSVLCESPWTSISEAKAVQQPVVAFLDIHYDIKIAGLTDDLSNSVDYSAACKSAQAACSSVDDANPPTAFGLAERILTRCAEGIDARLPVKQVDVELRLPKTVLRAKYASVKLCKRPNGTFANPILFEVSDLLVHTIIGIHPHERIDKQPVIINLSFARAANTDDALKFKFASLEKYISDFVETSTYLTVEALASEIPRKCLLWVEDPSLYTISVKVYKPAALKWAESPEISVTRDVSDFPGLLRHISEPLATSSTDKQVKTFAALAIGANLGDRFYNIELALRYLDDFRALLPDENLPSGDISVTETSFLYETQPMYVESQPKFINCACLVETTLSPGELLQVCKAIERVVGRVPSVRFGPRAVDLDIVTFGSSIVDTRDEAERGSLDNLAGHLVIPHPRMAEREFVLRPLNDIIPDWVHPHLHLTTNDLLKKVMRGKPADDPPMHKVVPFPRTPHTQQWPTPPSTLTYWVVPGSSSDSLHNESNFAAPPRTYVMATLNATPDSFSDGGAHASVPAGLAYARASITAGASIIDIGGCSTRPGATPISAAEESARVTPIILSIRADSDAKAGATSLSNIPISVDTFRPSVAYDALTAGANCINDVYACTGPAYPCDTESEEYFRGMLSTARHFAAPVIMMHSRGPAGANKDYSAYNKNNADATDESRHTAPVLEGIRMELGSKVTRAVTGRGALRRWQVIVDPGLGFSKSVEDNLTILRNAKAITAEIATQSAWPLPKRSLRNPLAAYPLLIGASRKSFLGTVLSRPATLESKRSDGERQAKDRDFATAAAVTCAVQQGATVVRVHEVQGMVDVVKVASALRF